MTKKDYCGKNKLMNCGLIATIIEYNDKDDITIEFEDGVIKKHIKYNSFISGRVSNKIKSNHLNETKTMNCGMDTTIIEYINATDIAVRFKDGTVVKHKTYDSFLKGKIKNPNFTNREKRLNETRMMNCGMKATIIEYNNAKDITIKFENGNISKHKTYGAFIRGGIEDKMQVNIKSNLIGQKFGRLTVIELDRDMTEKRGTAYWRCVCDCGSGIIKSFSTYNLEHGKSESCGCLSKEKMTKTKNTNSKYHIYDDENLVKYLVNEEDKFLASKSNQIITVKCPNCGYTKNMAVSCFTNGGMRCPNCANHGSYPNKFVCSVLQQLGINFETEKTFEWAEKKRYDFYIPSLSCIIEVNGLQHYEEHRWKWSTYKTLEEEQFNDKLKKENAIQNGINIYITIDARKSTLEYIKNSILQSKLNNLFDLTKVNWCLCDIKSQNNNFYECCKLYNDGKNIDEIADILKISKNHITTLLRKGRNINICNYETKEEKIIKKWNKIICLYNNHFSINDISKNKDINLSESQIKYIISKYKKGEIQYDVF